MKNQQPIDILNSLIANKELLQAFNQKITYSCKIHYEYPVQLISEGLNECQNIFNLELRKNFIFLINSKKECILKFKLSLQVQFQILRQKHSEKKQQQLKNNPVRGIKFIFKNPKLDLSFFSASKSDLEELISQISLQPVFEIGFQDEYKLIQRVIMEQEGTHYIVRNRQRNDKKSVRAIPLKLLEQDTFKKISVEKTIVALKETSHRNLTKLHRSFLSESAIYNIFQMTDFSLEQFIYKYGYPHYVAKKIILKSIISGTLTLHQYGLVHSKINPESIFMKGNKQNQGFCVKLGKTQSCLKYQLGTSTFLEQQLKDIEAIYFIFLQLLSQKKVYFQSDQISLTDFAHESISETQLDQANDLFQKLLGKNQKITLRESLTHPYLSNIVDLWIRKT